VLGSLWAGLGITNAIQNAFDKVWAVPMKDRPNFLKSRLRGLSFVALLGIGFIVSSVASGLVTGGLGGWWAKLAGIVLSLALNFGLYLAAFRILTSTVVKTSEMWIGVGVAAVLWEILQSVGGIYVDHVIKNASNTYGLFATVIGLLTWLHLGAQLTLYAAEVNVVVTRKLWPRSLFSPQIEQDERTLEAIAKVEERTPAQQIDVHFDRLDGDSEAQPQTGQPAETGSARQPR
jgi:uncharacterized BrkB/YihY/UPF0761 family membrane protein